MSKFYKAGAKVAALCKEILDSQSETFRKTGELAKQHGGVSGEFYVRRGVHGERYMDGFVFRDVSKVDTSIFRKERNNDDEWIPRITTKAGKVIAEQLKSFKSMSNCKLMEATGLDFFVNRRFWGPGIAEYGGEFYIEVQDGMEPKGCTRISDLEMESIRAKADKASKRKSRKKAAAV